MGVDSGVLIAACGFTAVTAAGGWLLLLVLSASKTLPVFSCGAAFGTGDVTGEAFPVLLCLSTNTGELNLKLFIGVRSSFSGMFFRLNGDENLNSLLEATGFFNDPEPTLKLTSGFGADAVGFGSSVGLDTAANANVGIVSFDGVTFESFFSAGAGKLLFSGISNLGVECMNGNATFGRFAGAGASSS